MVDFSEFTDRQLEHANQIAHETPHYGPLIGAINEEAEKREVIKALLEALIKKILEARARLSTGERLPIDVITCDKATNEVTVVKMAIEELEEWNGLDRGRAGEL